MLKVLYLFYRCDVYSPLEAEKLRWWTVPDGTVHWRGWWVGLYLLLFPKHVRKLVVILYKNETLLKLRVFSVCDKCLNELLTEYRGVLLSMYSLQWTFSPEERILVKPQQALSDCGRPSLASSLLLILISCMLFSLSQTRKIYYSAKKGPPMQTYPHPLQFRLHHDCGQTKKETPSDTIFSG